jgi:flagellar biosynthesis/type III secretory pathway protein FliH
VRSIGAVKTLLEWLDGTKDETEIERMLADEELAANTRESEAMYYDGMAEGEAKGKAEGMAEGEAKGKADLLSSLGVTNVAEYRSLFKADPPADLARILAK